MDLFDMALRTQLNAPHVFLFLKKQQLFVGGNRWSRVWMGTTLGLSSSVNTH